MVSQLSQEQIVALKPTLLNLTADIVKRFWSAILEMSPVTQATLIGCLESRHLLSLNANEVGPALLRLTPKLVESLSPELLSQVDSEYIFEFITGNGGFEKGIPGSKDVLSREQFTAIWPKIQAMEPADRAVSLQYLNPRYIAFLSAQEIGPVLGELPMALIQRLPADMLKKLFFPWITQMERKAAILFTNCLKNEQVFLLDEQQRATLDRLRKDDLSLEDFKNIGLDDAFSHNLEKLSATNVKRLWLSIINRGKEYFERLFNRLRPDQLALLEDKELGLLLFSFFSFEKLKSELIQALWDLFAKSVNLREIFINRLTGSQLLLVKMDDISSAANELNPIQIKEIWPRVLLMEDEVKKRLFIRQLKVNWPNQFERLTAADIAPVLHLMRPEQVDSLPAHIKSKLKLDLIFGNTADKSIDNLNPGRIKEIWPILQTLEESIQRALIRKLKLSQLLDLPAQDIASVIGKMSLKLVESLNWPEIQPYLDARRIKDMWGEISDPKKFDKEALRVLLNRLPTGSLSLLSGEELASAIGVLSTVQIQALSAEQVAEVWPKVILGMNQGDEDILKFVEQLQADQLTHVKPEERPIRDQHTPPTFEVGTSSEIKRRFLSPDLVKMFWPKIMAMDTASAALFINKHLQPRQLSMLGEPELELLAQSKVSDFLDPSIWCALWPEIVRSGSSTRSILIKKVTLSELKDSDIQLLLHSPSGAGGAAASDLSMAQKLELTTRIVKLENANLFTPESIKELWDAILWTDRSDRVKLLSKMSSQQLRLLTAENLWQVFGELTADQIRNLDEPRLSSLGHYICNAADPLDRIYFSSRLDPRQHNILAASGIILDERLTAEDLPHLNFVKVPPQHQSDLWQPSLLKQIWPHILKADPAVRQALLKQLKPHQLALLDASDLSPVLGELPSTLIESLSPQMIQKLWGGILKMEPKARLEFLANLRTLHYSLLAENDLIGVLGELTQKQIASFPIDTLKNVAKLLDKAKPLDRIYFVRCLSPDQRDLLLSDKIKLEDHLSQADRDKIVVGEIADHQLLALWPDLMLAGKITSLPQIRAILRRVLASPIKELFLMDLRNRGFFIFPQISPEEAKLIAREFWFVGLQKGPQERVAFIKSIPTDLLKWLPFEDLYPARDEMTVAQLKNVLDASLNMQREGGPFGELWPWTLEMDETRRNQLFRLFSPDVWPSYIVTFWGEIMKMDEPRRTSLLKSILPLLRPQEVKELYPWILRLNPLESRNFNGQFREDQLTLINSAVAGHKASSKGEKAQFVRLAAGQTPSVLAV